MDQLSSTSAYLLIENVPGGVSTTFHQKEPLNRWNKYTINVVNNSDYTLHDGNINIYSRGPGFAITHSYGVEVYENHLILPTLNPTKDTTAEKINNFVVVTLIPPDGNEKNLNFSSFDVLIE